MVEDWHPYRYRVIITPGYSMIDKDRLLNKILGPYSWRRSVKVTDGIIHCARPDEAGTHVVEMRSTTSRYQVTKFTVHLIAL